MKYTPTITSLAVVMLFSALALVSTNDVQKRFFLSDVGDFTIAKVREVLRNLYDPKPFEPAMNMEAKRVRERIGHTLANVTNEQLNKIVMAVDKVYIDSDVNPALSKLVFDVRHELGDTVKYVTDTEIGNVIYDILCQTKPEQEVIELVKVLTITAPFFVGTGG